MASILPLSALRPDPRYAARIAAPPYDVVDAEEAREIVRRNPCSFLQVTCPEFFADRKDPCSALRRAAEKFKDMRERGWFLAESSPACYIYRLSMPGGHVQTGWVVGASLDEYAAGAVRKHELTRSDKENERARHIEALGAQTGPVLMACRAHAGLREFTARCASASAPLYQFTDDKGIEHSLWAVVDQTSLRILQEEFQPVAALYIADGHHRAAAALRARETIAKRHGHATGSEACHRLLAAIFPHDELQVLGYHRLVADLNGLSAPVFLERISADFNVQESKRFLPENSGDFGLLLDGQWYRLTARPETRKREDTVEQLDASVLQDRILAPVLGIRDARTDVRIDFVGGLEGLDKLEQRCAKDARAAFTLAPVAMDQLMDVADKQKTMPPKSTWFEPKLRSGLVVHDLALPEEAGRLS